MADLDTTSKRRSSVQLMATYLLAPLFPDGNISQGDRQHIIWTYSGILSLAAKLPSSKSDFIPAKSSQIVSVNRASFY